MMDTPGLWFLSECRNPHCPIYQELSTLYIGCNRTFDFDKESKLCRCGACGHRLPSIRGIVFRYCQWSFRGQRREAPQPEESQEQTVEDIAACPEDKQEAEWEWLLFTVKSQQSLRPSKETQTTAQFANSRSWASQTELLLTLPELAPDLPGGVIGNEAVDTLVARVKRYKAKYRDLKLSSGFKRQSNQPFP